VATISNMQYTSADQRYCRSSFLYRTMQRLSAYNSVIFHVAVEGSEQFVLCIVCMESAVITFRLCLNSYLIIFRLPDVYIYIYIYIYKFVYHISVVLGP